MLLGGCGNLSSDVRADGDRCPDEILDDLLREEAPAAGELLLLPPPALPPVDVKSVVVAGVGSENRVRRR